MKRTWRQREAPGGVALHQLTSLLQGLRLGHPRMAQVRARVRLLAPCAPGGDLGCARIGEKVGQCGVEPHIGKEKGWFDVCRLAFQDDEDGVLVFGAGTTLSHLCGRPLKHMRS